MDKLQEFLKNKFIGVFLGGLILLLLLFYLRTQQTVIVTKPQPGPTIIPGVSVTRLAGKTLTGLEIAQASLAYVDSLKRSNGDYTTDVFCTKTPESASCTPSKDESYFPGMFVILFEDFANVTKNPKYQDRADFEMNRLMNGCEKDQDVCEWIFFPLFTRYQETKEEKYLQPMVEVGKKLLSKKSTSLNTFMLETRKLVMLFTLTQDKKYLDSAVERRNQLDTIADKDPANILSYTVADRAVRRYDCAQYGIDLDLYRVTKEKSYLTAAQTFFDQTRVGEHRGDFRTLPTVEACIDGLFTLENLTGETSYRDQAQQLTIYAVKAFWDSPYAKKFTGDFGFLAQALPGEKRNSITLPKYFTEHIWMMRLLLRFPKTTFELE